MTTINKISVNGFPQDITKPFGIFGPELQGPTILQQVLLAQETYPRAGDKETIIGAEDLRARATRSWPILNELGQLVEIRRETVSKCFLNADLKFVTELEIVSYKPEVK